MIKKRETCLYCNEKMESKTAKKKFCSALHRLYFNREIKRGTLKIYSQPFIHEECISYKELTNTITINEVKEPSIFNNIPVMKNSEQIGVVKYRIEKKESVPNEPILDSKKEDEIAHKNSQEKEYDFGNDKFLVMEKYTEYPSKNIPTNKLEKHEWLIKNQNQTIK